MTRWLLDTNVISELRKPRVHRSVAAWLAAQPIETLFLSQVTIAEVRVGSRQAPDAEFRAELERWADTVLPARFANRIIAIDEPTLVEWVSLTAQGKKANYTYPQPDAMLAAVARVHDLGVATRNAADFARAGVRVVNPWEPAQP